MSAVMSDNFERADQVMRIATKLEESLVKDCATSNDRLDLGLCMSVITDLTVRIIVRMYDRADWLGVAIKNARFVRESITHVAEGNYKR